MVKKFLIVGSCITFLISFVFVSCSEIETKNSDEGIIEFDTKAVDETHPLYGLAPSSAILKFKKEKFAIEMSTMGLFNTAIIGDIKNKKIAQTIKFMDIKQACIENEKDIITENLDFAIKIEETDETKDFLGIKARKLKVTMANNPTITFDAWYTKELGMEDCNALTPYEKVKGILLDYRIKKMGLEMHFVARSIKKVEVPENTFEIPASMKIVSKEEMVKFFTNLQ